MPGDWQPSQLHWFIGCETIDLVLAADTDW